MFVSRCRLKCLCVCFRHILNCTFVLRQQPGDAFMDVMVGNCHQRSKRGTSAAGGPFCFGPQKGRPIEAVQVQDGQHPVDVSSFMASVSACLLLFIHLANRGLE